MQKQGRPAEALAVYQALLEISPNHPSILYLAGMAHQSLGDLPGAVRVLSKAALLDRQTPEIHLQLGMVLREMGQPKLAKERFERALALQSELLRG